MHNNFYINLFNVHVLSKNVKKNYNNNDSKESYAWTNFGYLLMSGICVRRHLMSISNLFKLLDQIIATF